MKPSTLWEHNDHHTEPIRPAHNLTCHLARLGLLAMGITTAAFAQDETILLDQDNFAQWLNNSNPDLNNGNFRVIEDITLPPSWIPVGTSGSPASLRFNGSYHVISGLNATTEENNTPTGLFGYLVDSWVHSVILHQPVVVSHGNASEAGSIAGKILSTNITGNLVTGGLVETRGRGDVELPFFRDHYYSHAGGITGSASLSRIEDNLNNAAVNTIGVYCNAGGITGSQTDNSITSGNLNTGAVSTVGEHAFAGGATGFQKSGSTTSGNLNTGAISTRGVVADAGGATGFQSESCITSDNLNTGALRTEGDEASAGGATGYQTGNSMTSSMTSDNLNTGAVRTERQDAYAGGATGYQIGSGITSGNLNTGLVRTEGQEAHAGGATGYQAGNSMASSTTSDNLNTGAVRTLGSLADAGGATGSQVSSTTSGNVNTGAVWTNGTLANAGGAAGFPYGGTTSDNLNSGSVMAISASAMVNNFGSLSVTEQELSMGLNGLDGELWNSGDASQLPMLRGVNAAYRDLGRINGTRYGDNSFPMELEKFADPGGSMNASLFDLAVWNVGDGYLPFLKAIGRDRAEAVGIDCSEGGFACDPEAMTEPDPTTAPTVTTGTTEGTTEPDSTTSPTVTTGTTEDTTEPDSTTAPTTTPTVSTATTEGTTEPTPTTDSTVSTGVPEVTTELPAGDCPVPVGNPVFQAYDNGNQWLYVVHLSDVLGNEMALIRFRGNQAPVPDERFGDCGVQEFPPVPGLIEPLVTAGQLVVNPENDHLYLTVSSLGGEDKPVLLDFTLGETSATRSIYPALVGMDQRLNAMKAGGGRLYVTGEADQDSVLGWFQDLEINDDQLVRDRGVGHDLDLALPGEAGHAFMVGMSNGSEVFLRKYDLLARSREETFGENGQQSVLDGVTEHSQQSVLLHRGWVYVATNTESDGQLVIRRYDPETGAEDTSFGVSEETPGFINFSPGMYRFTDEAKRRSRVHLLGNEEYLHVLKYDRSGHIFATTYDTQGNGQEYLYRFVESLEFGNVADFGVAMTSGKIFLAYREPLESDAPNSPMGIYEVPIPDLVVMTSGNNGTSAPDSEADPRADSNADSWPWLLGAVGGGVVVVTAVTVVAVVAVKCFLGKHRVVKPIPDPAHWSRHRRYVISNTHTTPL